MAQATEQSERQAWDRRDGETSQAFEAFVAYRDMQHPRSVDAAYIAHLEKRASGDQSKSPPKQASGRWWSWNSQHEWRARCEAYDGYLELLRRQEHESEYVQHLDAHLERSRKIATIQQNIALRMLDISNKVLGGTANEAETALLANPRFASFVRAASRLSSGAVEMEQAALGIQEIAGMLQGDNERKDRP